MVNSIALLKRKMQDEGIHDYAIKNFEYYYEQLVSGQRSFIRESEIMPVLDIPSVESLMNQEKLLDIGQQARKHTIVLKLNGGLGTSMGLQRAKSIITVKDGNSFLDIIAFQALQSDVLLLFMNSYHTERDSMSVMAKYPKLFQRDIPLSFLQHKIPKIAQDSYLPAKWPKNPSLEWCPPGHGDVYLALITSGLVDKLLSLGYRYVFSSNSDNLGATLDDIILGYFVSNTLPFLMEVTERTEVDVKGGHIAYSLDGRLLLRESPFCPPDDLGNYEDASRHKYFNTNNLWFDLAALKEVMSQKGYLLELPLVINKKTIDPRDPDSAPILQLETVMGTGIQMFEGAGAIVVPRSRFSPIKTTEDLLRVRSDAYLLTDNFSVILNPKCKTPPVIHLDDMFFKSIEQFEARFIEGPPSLVSCTSLNIGGDYKFGKNVSVEGDVQLVNKTNNQRFIKDCTHLVGT